jgi:hypothetical protein
MTLLDRARLTRVGATPRRQGTGGRPVADRMPQESPAVLTFQENPRAAGRAQEDRTSRRPGAGRFRGRARSGGQDVANPAAVWRAAALLRQAAGAMKLSRGEIPVRMPLLLRRSAED